MNTMATSETGNCSQHVDVLHEDLQIINSAQQTVQFTSRRVSCSFKLVLRFLPSRGFIFLHCVVFG